jgi:uncharacterized membrane protein (DUF373 family)
VLDVALPHRGRRKVIVLDISKHDGLSVLALAALILSLGGAFYLGARQPLTSRLLIFL